MPSPPPSALPFLLLHVWGHMLNYIKGENDDFSVTKTFLKKTTSKVLPDVNNI